MQTHGEGDSLPPNCRPCAQGPGEAGGLCSLRQDHHGCMGPARHARQIAVRDAEKAAATSSQQHTHVRWIESAYFPPHQASAPKRQLSQSRDSRTLITAMLRRSRSSPVMNPPWSHPRGRRPSAPSRPPLPTFRHPSAHARDPEPAMASARLAYHSATGRRTFLLCVAVSFMPIQRSHTNRSLRLPSRSQTSSPSTRQRRQGSRDRCGCNEHACD